MSLTTVSVSNVTVTFTNNNIYDKKVAIKDVDVNTTQPIGTVIYIPVSGDANIYTQTTTSGLEYAIGSTTLKINSPEPTGLTKGQYYVVIDADPCKNKDTIKFFYCLPPSAAPPPAAPPVAPPSAASSVVVASKNDSMTIYKIKGNKVVSSATVKLSDISNAHIAKQNTILYNAEINKKIAGLYTWVVTNSIINDTMDSYNKYYSLFMTEVGNIIKNDEIELIIRKNRVINNTIINDMLVNSNAFVFNMSRIFNMLKDKNKFKFILYEIINNIFNILALQNNADTNAVIRNISKLKKSNIYENYFTHGDSHTYYMNGIDNAIKEELNLADTSFEELSSYIDVSKGALATIYGGSRKTKKRNQISKKQSRKTKKQSRNHKK